jgi:ubiquinone/menaquinone biosynthesis C-methylase UbiE
MTETDLRIKSIYDNFAETYDEFYSAQSFISEDQELFALFSDSIQKPVLDLGAGTGLALKYLELEPKEYLCR